MSTGLSGNSPLNTQRSRVPSLNWVSRLTENTPFEDQLDFVNPFEDEADWFTVTHTNPFPATERLSPLSSKAREAAIQFFITSVGGNPVEPETPSPTSDTLPSFILSPSISPPACQEAPADPKKSTTSKNHKKREAIQAAPAHKHQRHHHTTQPLNVPQPSANSMATNAHTAPLVQNIEPLPVTKKTKKQRDQELALLRHNVEQCYQQNPTWTYEKIATQCNMDPKLNSTRIREWLLPVIERKVWDRIRAIILKPAASHPDFEQANKLNPL